MSTKNAIMNTSQEEYHPITVTDEPNSRLANAIQAARLYYHQQLNTAAIAQELQVSRSTVSRLLRYAKEQGIVEVRIHDPRQEAAQLSERIKKAFGVDVVHVVPVPDVVGEAVWLERVAVYAAKYLNRCVSSHMTLGVAWGVTVNAIAHHLTPKPTADTHIVQLNGAGNTQSTGIAYASEIVMRFAENYGARPQLFPVPTFFDYADTKTALWRERSIQRILAMQNHADILLYSIGAVQAGSPSHVYSGGYLDADDLEQLAQEQVVGDIATVFFRADGSYADIPLNACASGPDLSLFRTAVRGICVVSGLGKVQGLLAALRGGFMTELIVDEPTARALAELLPL